MRKDINEQIQEAVYACELSENVNERVIKLQEKLGIDLDVKY